MRFPAPPPYKPPEPFVPYGVGWVELPDGLRILAVFTNCDPDELAIGMEVEMVTEKLREDEEGNEVITYKFQPVQGGRK
jgi:uncharacterized OB-fold protein